MAKSKGEIEEIERRWSSVNLTGTTISLAGSPMPGTTVHALRCAPADLAWLVGRVRALEAQVEGLTAP